MVRIYALIDKAVQILSRKSRAMTLNAHQRRLFFAKPDHFPGLTVPVSTEILKIHNLSQTENPRIRSHFLRILRIKSSSRCLQFFIGSRYTGRDRPENILLRFLAHKAFYAFHAKHIGDLMGICYNGSHSIGKCGPGKFHRSRHRTFNVHVDVYKPRDHIFSLSVNGLYPRINNCRGNAIKLFPCNCHIPLFKTLSVGHKDICVFNNKISGHIFSPTD